MKTLRSKIKGTLERISGDRVWLEHASDLNEVHALIRSLAPKPIEQNLIRVGSDGDGGYLLPDDLNEINFLVSPGVSTEIGFDLEMASRGINVLMADASVSGPPVAHERFNFVKKFIDVFEDDGNTRLDSLIKSRTTTEKTDNILQMDIEGAEYRTLLDLSEETLKTFRIMVIEFHYLDKIFAAFPFEIIQATFQKLLRHHHVVHIHPNNVLPVKRRKNIEVPPIMEFTFYRKDRATLKQGGKSAFPHTLDRKNIEKHADVILPKCWQ
jgi:hypothetical protein